VNDQTQVRIQPDYMRMGIKVHVLRKPGDGTYRVRDFGAPMVKTYRIDDTVGMELDAQPMWLDEDEARALYEALADHFGHSGNDTRALRRDYDAERSRVDRLITFAIGPK